jgi:hypothetical protein
MIPDMPAFWRNVAVVPHSKLIIPSSIFNTLWGIDRIMTPPTGNGPDPSAPMAVKSWRGLFIVAGLGAVAAATLALVGGETDCRAQATPRPNTAIFQGVVYGCERLAPSEEGRGVIHWVRVDLKAPRDVMINERFTARVVMASAPGPRMTARSAHDRCRRGPMAAAPPTNQASTDKQPSWLPRSHDRGRDGKDLILPGAMMKSKAGKGLRWAPWAQSDCRKIQNQCPPPIRIGMGS